jgi:hypothetical protein
VGLRAITHRARSLRQEETEAERALWRLLRGRQLGLKFRRQTPVGHFVVDFLCREASVVLEVDGPIHDTCREYDAEREAWLWTPPLYRGAGEGPGVRGRKMAAEGWVDAGRGLGAPISTGRLSWKQG